MNPAFKVDIMLNKLQDGCFLATVLMDDETVCALGPIPTEEKAVEAAHLVIKNIIEQMHIKHPDIKSIKIIRDLPKDYFPKSKGT